MQIANFYVKAKDLKAENLIGSGKVLCVGVIYTGNEFTLLCVSNGGIHWEKGRLVEIKSQEVFYEGSPGDSVPVQLDATGDLSEVQETLETLKKEIHGLKTSLGKLKKT